VAAERVRDVGATSRMSVALPAQLGPKNQTSRAFI
jgi:hypothetical protein